MEIIPFGKYKGKPVEVLAQDKQCLEWLTAQSWFIERYRDIHTLIVNNFQESSETPEHNKIQALFTDKSFCSAFANTIIKRNIRTMGSSFRLKYPTYKLIRKYEITNWKTREKEMQYEVEPVSIVTVLDRINSAIKIYPCLYEEKGVDVIFGFEISPDPDQYEGELFTVFIEIKPTLSDDYPAVLRQMKTNNSEMLLIGDFNAIGATFDQVTEIFRTSHKHIIIIPKKFLA